MQGFTKCKPTLCINSRGHWSPHLTMDKKSCIDSVKRFVINYFIYHFKWLRSPDRENYKLTHKIGYFVKCYTRENISSV